MHCEPHGDPHRHDSHEHHRGARGHDERHDGPRGDHSIAARDRVADLIATRLSFPRSFDFESLLQQLDRGPAGPALKPQEIAARWQAIAAYANALGDEDDEDVDGGALLGWLNAGRPEPAGWGFEGSVGATHRPGAFQALQGLTEGFRKL
jgi:hypothetical protein